MNTSNVVLEHGRPAARPGRLLRVLGLAFGLAVGVGSAIGVGILRVPALVAAQLPDPLWMWAAWLLVTAYIFVHANTLAELSAMLPEAGGPYVYVSRAFGGFTGFITGWTDWVMQVTGIAFMGAAFADFLPELWPGAAAYHGFVAAGLIAAFAGYHALGVREGRAAQLTLSVVKVVGFAAIIAACFAAGPSAGVEVAAPSAVTHALPLAAFLISWQLIKETYGGFQNALYFSEENTDPGRSIPRALFGSVGIVALVYLSGVAALVLVLGMDALAGSVLPLADAARVALGTGAGRAVVAVALLSLLGLLNATVMVAPRILFALSRHGEFARVATKVNAGGTPLPALLVTAAAAIPLALTGTFEQLFLLTALLGVAIDVVTNATLFVLRRREPALPRPFRARGYPLLPGIAVAVPCAVVVGSLFATPGISAVTFALIAVAYPVYRLIERRGPRAGRPTATPD